MVVKSLFGGCLAVFFPLLAITQTPAIGNWREHLPYHQAIRVTGSAEKIWCATPYSIFTLDLQDNSISRMSKITGLSETGISALAYDPQANKLIIAYTNSNIDILAGSRIFHIPDIKQAAFPGDKTVYDAFVYKGRTYLSTGLGVIVLDEDKYEVKDTYILGSNGDTVATRSFTADDHFFYAATEEGLKQASVLSGDLTDFRNWSLLSGAAGLPAGPCRQVTVLGSQVLALVKDSVFLFNGSAWNFFYTDGWSLNNLAVSNGQLLLCEQKPDSGRVLSLTATGSPEKILQAAGVLQSPRQALVLGDQTFVADSVYGLSEWTSDGPHRILPNSPASLASGEMTFSGNLWVASGGVDSSWAPLNNKSGLYRFGSGGWTNYDAAHFPVLDNIFDFVSVAVNPQDNSVWAGSFGQGLLQIRSDSSFTIYGKNSPLGPVQGDPSVYRVSGLAFDAAGNGWIANYGAANDLVLRKADGNWLSFSIPFAHAEHAVAQVLIDDFQQVWIISPKGNGLFCYDHGASVDNTSDDQWKYYRAGIGNGNLPDNNVNCIAKDRNGFIWVGTANGIGVIQCAGNIFKAGGCEAVLPIVQFDNFAGYLFSGEQVQAIAVDGADRKWVGTRNGVWLLSSDAKKILAHFTEENSPLLSNDLRRIAIDPVTGEVFFSTAKGICSFRGEATEGGKSNSNVLVFPNPVPPGYTGTIAIRGLVENAIVKITELNGRLVYQTRALGGQAVWNGEDYKGRRAATGVYLVLISDDSRQEKLATKIVFIGR